MDSILSRSHLPFIVGGTNYYIESLLFHLNPPHAKSEQRHTNVSSSLLSDLSDEHLAKLTSVQLHELLTKVDKATSIRRHPNEERKIRRFERPQAREKNSVKNNGNVKRGPMGNLRATTKKEEEERQDRCCHCESDDDDRSDEACRMRELRDRQEGGGENDTSLLDVEYRLERSNTTATRVAFR